MSAVQHRTIGLRHVLEDVLEALSDSPPSNIEGYNGSLSRLADFLTQVSRGSELTASGSSFSGARHEERRALGYFASLRDLMPWDSLEDEYGLDGVKRAVASLASGNQPEPEDKQIAIRFLSDLLSGVQRTHQSSFSERVAQRLENVLSQ